MISIPFLGSKRNYVRPVEELVSLYGYRKVFEPFGGSAVLSVNLYNDGIIDKAFINDFDHLFDLYPSYLDLKDEIIKKCFDYGMEKSKKKLSEKDRAFVQGLISQVDEDYIPLLANNFVFSGRAADKARVTDFNYFFNETGTEKQRHYLSVVNKLDRSTLDYKDFLDKHKNEFDSDSLIILDPPYLNSAQKHYKNSEFFGLADTIEMLEKVRDTGVDFLYFNMVERDTKKLLEALGFNIVNMQVKHQNLNYGARREDVLALVHQDKTAAGVKIA